MQRTMSAIVNAPNRGRAELTVDTGAEDTDESKVWTVNVTLTSVGGGGVDKVLGDRELVVVRIVDVKVEEERVLSVVAVVADWASVVDLRTGVTGVVGFCVRTMNMDEGDVAVCGTDVELFVSSESDALKQ